jgi:hypothetical protein
MINKKGIIVMEILRVTWAKRGKDPQDLEGATTIKRVVKDAALAIIKIYAHCWYCRRWSKRLWHEFNSLLCKQSRERKWHRRVLLFWDCSWAKTRGKESVVQDPLAIDRFESCPHHTQHCSYCSKRSVSIPGGEETSSSRTHQHGQPAQTNDVPTRSHAKDWRRDWRASLTITGPTCLPSHLWGCKNNEKCQND